MQSANYNQQMPVSWIMNRKASETTNQKINAMEVMQTLTNNTAQTTYKFYSKPKGFGPLQNSQIRSKNLSPRHSKVQLSAVALNASDYSVSSRSKQEKTFDIKKNYFE